MDIKFPKVTGASNISKIYNNRKEEQHKKKQTPKKTKPVNTKSKDSSDAEKEDVIDGSSGKTKIDDYA